MAQQYIHEGTAQELAPYLAQRPNGRFRLIELADEAEESKPEKPESVVDAKGKAALALLETWIAEGEAATEETRQTAEQEVEEFKSNMNANRAATGERIVYP